METGSLGLRDWPAAGLGQGEGRDNVVSAFLMWVTAGEVDLLTETGKQRERELGSGGGAVAELSFVESQVPREHSGAHAGGSTWTCSWIVFLEPKARAQSLASDLTDTTDRRFEVRADLGTSGPLDAVS